MLTPLDIHSKEFRRGFRGYNEEEVDEFLDQVVQEFERLLRDNALLKEHMEEVQQKLEHFQHLEETLHNTLIVAQETAEDVKESARKEADLIVREATMKAERLAQEAEDRVRDRNAQLADVQRQSLAFRAQVRSLFESQLELLRGTDEILSAVEREPVA